MTEIDQYGRLIRRTRPNLPDTHNATTYASSSSYSDSSWNWWSRLNNCIIDIGNWLSDHTEDITSILVFITAGIGVIGLGLWVLSMFFNDGIITGILSIVGACIMGYLLFICIGIGAWVLGMLLVVVRFVFWNIYTLLIAIALISFLTVANVSTHNSTSHQTTTQQYTASQTTTYYCTTKTVLNIRSNPNLSANVIGTLKPNQAVEVYEIKNGFAKIKYGTTNAYVSSKYISKYRN